MQPVNNLINNEPEGESLLFHCDLCSKQYEPDSDSILEFSQDILPDSYLKELEDSGESFLDFPVFGSNVEFHWRAKRFVSCCPDCQNELKEFNY